MENLTAADVHDDFMKDMEESGKNDLVKSKIDSVLYIVKDQINKRRHCGAIIVCLKHLSDDLYVGEHYQLLVLRNVVNKLRSDGFEVDISRDTKTTKTGKYAFLETRVEYSLLITWC